MTTPVGGQPTEYALLGRLVADSATVRKRLDSLTRQAGDGLVANTYAGLGTGASVSLALDRQVASLQTGQSNIDAATGRMGVTQSAMTQLQAIAANFQARLSTLNGLNPSYVDSVAADARAALEQVATVLNSRYGDDYVFAGEDTANPPVPSPDTILTSGFVTQIQAAVGQLGVNGAAATAASTLAIAGSDTAGTTPFSSYLSGTPTNRPVVDTGDSQRVPVGLLANANGAVASTGSSTTGSYVRDLMRSLATLGSLSSSQLSASGFPALVQDTRATLDSAITAMAADTGVLGDTQRNLTAMRASMDDTIIALKSQISSSRDVDMAMVLSSLTQVQSQLQASYQLIGTLGSLSLAKYLPGA